VFKKLSNGRREFDSMMVLALPSDFVTYKGTIMERQTDPRG
jgi:hypothetical protein